MQIWRVRGCRSCAKKEKGMNPYSSEKNSV